MKNPKKFKIKNYSHNDGDGGGSGILLSSLDEIKSSCEYHTYYTLDAAVKEFILTDEYKKYDMIYITDISFREQEVIDLIENLPEEEKSKFKLFDHHVPYSDWLKKYSWCNIAGTMDGRKTCGTEMFYYELLRLCGEKQFENALNILQSEVVKDFVESIRLYDTWDWSVADDKTLNKYQPVETNMLFYIWGISKFIKSMKEKIKVSGTFEFTELEKSLIDLEKQNQQKYFEKKIKEIEIRDFEFIEVTELGDEFVQVRILNYKMGIVFAEQHISDLGSYIMNNNTDDIDFVLIISAPKKGSFRTNKSNVDVSEIAKVFEGGGHPQASGFNLTPKYLKEIVSWL